MKRLCFRFLVLLAIGACFVIACNKENGSGVTKYTVVCDPDTDLCWQDPQREAYNYEDQGVRAFEADQYCEELVLGGFD